VLIASCDHKHLLFAIMSCATELAILKSEIARIRRVHISRIRQFENPNIYLCCQCQSLLKNKKKAEDKHSKIIESRLLAMDLLPVEGTRTVSHESSEIRNLPPDADVIVRLFKYNTYTI